MTVAIKRAGYGVEYDGFGAADCQAVTGDHTRAAITWKTRVNLDELKGHYIRLRIQGRNLAAFSAAFEGLSPRRIRGQAARLALACA